MMAQTAAISTNKTPSTLTWPNHAKLPSDTFHYTIASMLQVLPAILNIYTCEPPPKFIRISW